MWVDIDLVESLMLVKYLSMLHHHQPSKQETVMMKVKLLCHAEIFDNGVCGTLIIVMPPKI